MEKFIHNLDLTSKGVWFPIVLGIISTVYLIFMPKRLSWREIYFIYGVSAFVAITLDVIILGSQIDLFDLGSPDTEGIGDLFSYGLVAPSFAIIFLNYLKPDKIWLYVIGFTLLSFSFEWLLVQLGYMKLKGWNTVWSIFVYILVYRYWLPWQLRLLRKVY